VIGAGASASSGIPLTNSLLPHLVRLLDRDFQKRLSRFIEYLYPRYHDSWGNLPALEELLSQIDVFLDFNERVKKKHKFKNAEIRELKASLLRSIRTFLSGECHMRRLANSPIYLLAKRLGENDSIVTLNWDLLLERALTDHGIHYSYEKKSGSLTVSKPHGSINWLLSGSSSKLTGAKRSFQSEGKIVVCAPESLPEDHDSVPAIIPPSIAKKWPPAFDAIWKQSWSSLHNADEVYILGFSLPPEDLHVRFVMRTAIRANESGRTRSLLVKLVNPDRSVYLRFASLMSSRIEHFEARLENVAVEELLRQ